MPVYNAERSLRAWQHSSFTDSRSQVILASADKVNRPAFDAASFCEEDADHDEALPGGAA
jgi:hypothetical protein